MVKFDWINSFTIPLIKVVAVGGVILWVGFVATRGIYKTWQQQTKWILKYKIMRNKYPEETLKWCMDSIEGGIGYYDVKKMLFLHNFSDMNKVYETLFIYDQMVITMHKLQGKKKTPEQVTSNAKFKKTFNSAVPKQLPIQNQNQEKGGKI